MSKQKHQTRRKKLEYWDEGQSSTSIFLNFESLYLFLSLQLQWMYIQNKYLQVKQEYEIDFAKDNIQNEL